MPEVLEHRQRCNRSHDQIPAPSQNHEDEQRHKETRRERSRRELLHGIATRAQVEQVDGARQQRQGDGSAKNSLHCATPALRATTSRCLAWATLACTSAWLAITCSEHACMM